MRVGRVVSAWLGGLLRIVLCLGVALSAACNPPKEKAEQPAQKAEQPEAGQTASDGSACGGEERYLEARRAWGEAIFDPLQKRQPLVPAQVAEVERLYRDLAACMKQALLAGRLADPKDHIRYSDALHYWADSLHHLGREEEAEAQLAERMALSDADLSDANIWNHPLKTERRRLLHRALGSGDLTLIRSLAEENIALALKAGITTEEIRDRVRKYRANEIGFSPYPPTAPTERELLLDIAVIFQNALDIIAEKENATVCGKVTISEGIKGKITATIFNGYEKFFVTVDPDEGYCLPVRIGYSTSAVYVFLQAIGYQPNVIAINPVRGERNMLPDKKLSPYQNPKMGSIFGVLVETDGVWSDHAIANPVSGVDVFITGSDEMSKTTTTNDDGVYSIALLPGTYRVTIDKSDYAWCKGIDVLAGQSDVCSVELVNLRR